MSMLTLLPYHNAVVTNNCVPMVLISQQEVLVSNHTLFLLKPLNMSYYDDHVSTMVGSNQCEKQS